MRKNSKLSPKKNSKRASFRPGDAVVVVGSWNSDVVPGFEGTVVKLMGQGIAVTITAVFTDAAGHRQMETRCMYFDVHELRRRSSGRTSSAGVEAVDSTHPL